MKVHTEETQATITPEKAVQFLKEGNERFINNLKINRKDSIPNWYSIVNNHFLWHTSQW